MALKFTNSRTVESVKSETKSAKLFMFPAFIGSGDNKKKLTYKDASGVDTGVQKYVVENEAGVTIGWCAMSVAKDVAAGGLRGPVAFVDAEDDETGDVYANKLIYPAKREGGVELI